ncbi:MAG: endopeptidase La [Planctomycetota bacterium]|jgi:ATP-dependent Lon protease
MQDQSPPTEPQRNESAAPAEPAETPQPAAPPLPEDALIILAVRGMVLFPGVVVPVTVGRPRSLAAVQEAARSECPLGVLLQRDVDVEEPTPEHLHRVGTVSAILRYLTAPDGTHHVICQGQQRFRVVEFLEGYPFFAARVELVEEVEKTGKAIEALTHHVKQQALEALKLLPHAPPDLVGAVSSMTSASSLTDLIGSFMDLKPEEKQGILARFDIEARLSRLTELLAHRIEVLRLSHEISEQTKETVDKQQREYMLREQLKTIQKELGETDSAGLEIEELTKAIADARMPPEVEQQAQKELTRLKRTPEAAIEHSMIRTYLDWLVELPWSKLTEDALDITRGRAILDEDHFDLDKVKKRIVEHLAVRKLNPEGKSPILCFVGPPGVGKTSLGQSIARAMGRKFVRLSLGGIHDEAEIRGHRRTYIGALPGNIVQSIRKAGTRNPVFMLDELDKIGASFHGDPSSALLEVLDPEQNSTFRDNYLGVPLDLSKVMFIGTANVLESIPGALRDRLEVIELPGYTEDEKVEIARRYLVARQLESNGLKAGQCEISDDALRKIVREYTREAGCRNLEREIGSAFRSVATRIAEGAATQVRIDAADLPDILGPRKFESEVALRTSVPGVATALAWTPTGGDILFVEATQTPGTGKLILTGQLGEVMKESAQAALSLVKSKWRDLDLPSDLFEKSDIHVHVPAGAIPKDGPSAGIAMYVALVSLVTHQQARNDTAMTGEISLRGLVLPVGGIKEKVVAALRAGIQTVILPSRNRKDLDEVPQGARDYLTFVWAERVDDAIRAAIGHGASATGPQGPGPEPPLRISAKP